MCDNALVNDAMSCKPMLIDHKLIIFCFFFAHIYERYQIPSELPSEMSHGK